MARLSNLIAMIPLLALVSACDDAGGACRGVTTTKDEISSALIDPANLDYEVHRKYGHFDGFAFLIQDPVKHRCIRILLNESSNLAPLPRLDTGIQPPSGYAVKQMEITDDLTDCLVEGSDLLPPSGCHSEQAANGFGRIERVTSDPSHLTLDLHVTLLFTAGGVIPPESVVLDAEGLELEP